MASDNEAPRPDADEENTFYFTIHLKATATDGVGLQSKHSFLWDGMSPEKAAAHVPDIEQAIGRELIDRLTLMTQWREATERGEDRELWEFIQIEASARPVLPNTRYRAGTENSPDSIE